MRFTLRTATQTDQDNIRSLIYRVKINPFGLNWQQFVVAVSSNGELIGCGQVKKHPNGIRELASIAVDEAYRNMGIARAIIEHLTNISQKPIYLTCRSGLESFYKQFGFETLPSREIPPVFRRRTTLSQIFFNLTFRKEKLLVMQYR